MALRLLCVGESAAPFQVLEQRLPGSFEIGAAKPHSEQPAAHEVLFCFRLLALRVYAVRGLGEGDHLGHQQHPKRTVLRHREIHPQLSLFQLEAFKVAQRFEIPQQFSVGFKVFRRVFLQPGDDRILDADAGGAEGFAQQVLLAVEHVNQVGDVRHRQFFRRYANLNARLFRFRLRFHPALGNQERFHIGGLFIGYVDIALSVNGDRAHRVVERGRASVVRLHAGMLCNGFDQRTPVRGGRGEFHIHASFSFGMPFITLKALQVKRMR